MAALLFTQPLAAERSRLDSLLHLGRIDLQVIGTGGHAGECVEVEVINKLPSRVDLFIPAGWRFGSQDSTIQDLLVVKDEVLALAPHGRTRVTCRAFCCEASMGGPMAGTRFHSGGMASAALVKLAEQLAAGRYADAAIQQAVWAVSDEHPISAIDAGDAAATLALRQLVSGITGRPVPWYTTAFAAPEEGRVFNPAPVRMTGRVEFQQRHAGILSIVVKDAAGRTIRVLDEGRDLRQGRYSIDVELTVQGWPKGQYSILFAVDGTILKRQGFEL